MRIKLYRIAVVAVGLIIAFSLRAHPGGHQDTPFQIISHDWDGKVPTNKVVYVKNEFGSIRSRSNSEEKVFMHATYQRIGIQALSPIFDIKELDGNLYITIKYDESIRDSNGALRGRTDISVLFPPSVKIIAETTSGMIKIDKTHSHVDAKTTSGKIKLTTTGLFSAITDSGKIHLRLRGMHTKGESSAFSNSGEILADVFNDMDIRLDVITKRDIFVDGSKLENKNYIYKNGSEGSTVKFTSKMGNIKINKIAPPALVKSVIPTSKKIDLRDLPKAKPWKPGDPTKEVNPKRTNSKNK